MAEVKVVTLENGKKKLITIDPETEDVEGGTAMAVYQTDDCIDGGDANG